MTMHDFIMGTDREFGIRNEKEFKRFNQFANRAFRDGVLSKELYFKLIFWLFLFKIQCKTL